MKPGRGPATDSIPTLTTKVCRCMVDDDWHRQYLRDLQETPRLTSVCTKPERAALNDVTEFHLQLATTPTGRLP